MIDLDVDSPGRVADALREAAERYYESASELQAAWQDPTLDVWEKLASILERAANECDKAVME